MERVTDNENCAGYMCHCADRICRPGGLEITRQAARLCGWQAGDRVVDLGCGSGVSLHFLKQEFGLRMQGLEADASLCDGHNIVYGDAATLPWETASLDGILMECSFSRMTAPAQVLAECRRVLRPGGRLAISDMISRGEEICPGAGRGDSADVAEAGASLGRLEHVETITARLTAAGFFIAVQEDWTSALQQMWGQLVLEGGREAARAALGYDRDTLKRARCGYYLWICEPAPRKS